MDIDKQLREALKMRYQGEVAAAKANISVYMKHPVGIGEHSDLIAAIDEQLNLLTAAEEKIKALEVHYEPLRV